MEDNAGGSVNWLVDLVTKPGTAVRLVPAINAVLVLILLILLGLVISGQTSVHVYAMGFLSVGLMTSVNWFMSEYYKAKEKQEQEAAMGGGMVAAGAVGTAPPREKGD